MFIDFYENAENNIVGDNFELIHNLEIIALKDHASSGFAQAFHYYLTGDFVNNLDLSLPEDDGIAERSSEYQDRKYEDKKLNLFPNPASDLLQIENANLIQRLNVYDLTGNSIFESGERSTINTKDWIRGVYVIKISQKDGDSFQTKILIIK